jgi:threonyl-tRNA synthetase
LIPITNQHAAFANKIKEDLQKEGLRVIIDERNESLNKRIREATLKKIPYLLIIGDREINNHQVAVRKYSIGDQGSIPIEQFVQQIQQEIKNKS